MNDFTISSSSENVELALEEESMAFTAAIFVVRCSYQLFKYLTIIRNSGVAYVKNSLAFNKTDKRDTDMTLEILSPSFFGPHPVLMKQ